MSSEFKREIVPGCHCVIPIKRKLVPGRHCVCPGLFTKDGRSSRCCGEKFYFRCVSQEKQHRWCRSVCIQGELSERGTRAETLGTEYGTIAPRHAGDACRTTRRRVSHDMRAVASGSIASPECTLILVVRRNPIVKHQRSASKPPISDLENQ